jgi:hypothetical protein
VTESTGIHLVLPHSPGSTRVAWAKDCARSVVNVDRRTRDVAKPWSVTDQACRHSVR